jgi:hypothetical protein
VPTVVTDAGPLHYLVLIEAETVLPRLFGAALAINAKDVFVKKRRL